MQIGKALSKWGRGTQTIVELCVKAGHPSPEFAEMTGSVVVTFHPASGSIAPQVTPPLALPVTPPVILPVGSVLCLLEHHELGNAEIRQLLGLKDRAHLREHYIDPALAEGLIEATIPDKPKSRLQKYQLTAKGQAWLLMHQSKIQDSSSQS